MEDSAKVSLKKIKIIVVAIVAVLLIITGGVISNAINDFFNKEKITTAYISGKLENISELTTQKLTYTGIVEISEGTIPLISKKGFSMKYTATMEAGINLSDVEVKISKKTVKIKIPHASLQMVKVDADSVDFYDEKFALFNWNKKEDITQAITKAEDDAKNNGNYEQLIKNADEYAKLLIFNMFDGSVGDREIKISYK